MARQLRSVGIGRPCWRTSEFMCNTVEVLLAKYMAGINSGKAEKLGKMEA